MPRVAKKGGRICVKGGHICTTCPGPTTTCNSLFSWPTTLHVTFTLVSGGGFCDYENGYVETITGNLVSGWHSNSLDPSLLFIIAFDGCHISILDNNAPTCDFPNPPPIVAGVSPIYDYNIPSVTYLNVANNFGDLYNITVTP